MRTDKNVFTIAVFPGEKYLLIGSRLLLAIWLRFLKKKNPYKF